MADVIAYGSMALWIILLAWIVLRLGPKSSTRMLALIAVGCAALAIGFFWVYQWAGYPILAYVDSITFGLNSLLAVLLLWQRWLRSWGSDMAPAEKGPSEAVE
jgi:hypothetical protein